MTSVVFSQETDDKKLLIGGQLEWFGIATQHGGQFKAEDRLERYQIFAEKGPFYVVATWLSVPLFSLQELNETYIRYTFGKSHLRFGRVMPLIGQSNWEDQWYSGFVMLPYIETALYDSNLNLSRTINGVDLSTPIGNHTLQLSGLSSNDNNEKNKWIAKSLNRLAFRIEGSSGGTIYGIGALGDAPNLGRDVVMYVADIRHTMPSWMFRGEFISFQRGKEDTGGFFFDITHRPARWSDLTFVGRYQQIHSNVPGVLSREGFSFGSKVRLPYDFGLDVNFSFGPHYGSRAIGGGWEFQLRRTFTF